MDDNNLDTRSAADIIASKAAANEQPPAKAQQPLPGPEPTPWKPEEWRAGKFLVVRYIPQPNTPQLKRQVYGSGRMGNYATPFESEESAQKCADRLNEEGSNDE